MDLLTCDLLKRWGLHEYVNQFRVGRVDSGTLRILTDAEITQLIPVPGDRARFKLNLNNWKHELADLHRPDIGSLSSGLNEDSELLLSRSSLSLGSILRTSVDLESDFSRSYPSATITSEALDVQHFPLELASIPLQPQQSCLGVKTHSPEFDETTLNYNQSGTVQCGYVLKTLKSSIDGRAILTKKDSGKLEESQRNILVKLLLQPIFEKDPNVQISNTQLLSWSLEIQEIFVRESAALYYTPYISALVQTTARNASGKLLRYVYNKRQQMRNRGIIKRARTCSSTRTSSSASSSSEVAPLIRLPCESAECDEETREKLVWLRNSLEPKQLIEEKWAATSAYRLKLNYLAGSSLQDYFNEYPFLKSPTGFQLLLADFQVLYPLKTDSLFTNIVAIRDKIIEVAKLKIGNIRDKDIKQTIQGYLNTISDTDSPDVKNNGTLMLVPYITSSIPLKEKKKTLWRPSKSEVRDGFVTQIGADSELETVVTSRKSKLERFGKTLQPFVIFVGPSISEISHCYVIAGDTYYKITKLLSAVDACFKIIHATGAKYQSEAYVVWMVIQKAFYDIATPYDKDLITVKSLLIDLGISP